MRGPVKASGRGRAVNRQGHANPQGARQRLFRCRLCRKRQKENSMSEMKFIITIKNCRQLAFSALPCVICGRWRERGDSMVL